MDIRLPMGWFFSIVGVMLIGQHVLASTGGSAVNLVWGIVVLAFGATMLSLARCAARCTRKAS
jgi:hypothetical protein